MSGAVALPFCWVVVALPSEAKGFSHHFQKESEHAESRGGAFASGTSLTKHGENLAASCQPHRTKS